VLPKVPEGWCFYSADFSMVASGVSKRGSVTLVRSIEQRTIWQSLPDALKDGEAAIPLFIMAQGISLEEAFYEAVVKAGILKQLIRAEYPLVVDCLDVNCKTRVIPDAGEKDVL
jgi:hypothetical protein